MVNVRLCKDNYLEFYYPDEDQVISDCKASDWSPHKISHYQEKSWFNDVLLLKCDFLASSGCQVVAKEAT